MTKILRYLALAKAFLWMLWPTTAVAAARLTFGDAMQEITAFEWIFIWLLTTLGGIASLLQRVSDLANEAVKTGRPLQFDLNLWLLISTHLFGSWLAGFVAFFWAQHQQMPGFYIALFTPLMSFGSIQTVRFFYGRLTGIKNEAKAN